jgi:hypothetical protein
MAKKSKNKQSAPPQAQPIPQINLGQTYTSIAKGVPQFANAVSNANLQGVNLGNYTLANYLQTGGRSMTLDPAAAAGFNKTINTNTKLVGSTNKKISSTEKGIAKLESSIAKTTDKTKAAAAASVSKLDKTLTSLNSKLASAKPDSKQYKTLQKQVASTTAKRDEQQKIAESGSSKKVASLQSKLTGAQSKLTGFKGNLEKYNKAIEDSNNALNVQGPSIDDIYYEADPYTYEYLDLADTYAQELGKITEQGQQFLDQAKQSYQAAPIQQERVNVASVEAGPLGQALYAQAMDKANSLGRLTPEQERDALQSARAGMAARGLGIGQSAMAVEMLNRDRFSRQRQQEDLGFAQNVLQNDLGRQFQNQQNQLAAGGINVENNFRAQAANEQNRLGAVQQTLNQLGQASNYVDATRRAGMTAAVDMANVRSTYNPLFRNLGMSQQNFFGTNNLGTAALGPSAQIGMGVTEMNNANNQFNANMLDSRYNSFQNNQAALRGAGIQAGATAGASQNSMMGSGIAAGGMVLGMTALAI